MDTIEVSGRTLEEAVQMAAQELGIGTDGVEYEVVQEGSKGFLGLGGLPAEIKAWVKEGYEMPKPKVAESVSAGEPLSPEEKAKDNEAFTDNLMSIVNDILEAMKVDATPSLKSASDEEVEVDIVGKDVAILIGKHGQTLDALQYIVGIGANKGHTNKRRVIIDAEGYRARYKEMLVRKAHEYAAAVKDAGKEAVLEPQTARDRRVMHMALADDSDVYTYSEGTGDDRHLVISPKK